MLLGYSSAGLCDWLMTGTTLSKPVMLHALEDNMSILQLPPLRLNYLMQCPLYMEGRDS